MKFERKFGESWRTVLKAGRAFNALDAANHMGMSDSSLSRAWQRAVDSKDFILVEGTTLCARLVDQRKQNIYVINGQYMKTRAHFTKKGAQIFYLSVKWDPKVTSWSQFYQMVTGHSVSNGTKPVSVVPESLQGILFSEWRNFGLDGLPPTSPIDRDLLYFSASALQGMADRVNWLDVPISADTFGRELLDAEVDAVVVRRLRNDPQLKDGSRLFDECLGLDVADCLEVCIAVSNFVANAGIRDADIPSDQAAGRFRRAQRPTIKRASATDIRVSDQSGDARNAGRLSFSDQGDDSAPDESPRPRRARRSAIEGRTSRSSITSTARQSRPPQSGSPAVRGGRRRSVSEGDYDDGEAPRRSKAIAMPLTRRAKASPTVARKGGTQQRNSDSAIAISTPSKSERGRKSVTLPRQKDKKVMSLELDTEVSRVSLSACGSPIVS